MSEELTSVPTEVWPLLLSKHQISHPNELGPWGSGPGVQGRDVAQEGLEGPAPLPTEGGKAVTVAVLKQRWSGRLPVHGAVGQAPSGQGPRAPTPQGRKALPGPRTVSVISGPVLPLPWEAPKGPGGEGTRARRGWTWLWGRATRAAEAPRPGCRGGECAYQERAHAGWASRTSTISQALIPENSG